MDSFSEAQTDHLIRNPDARVSFAAMLATILQVDCAVSREAWDDNRILYFVRGSHDFDADAEEVSHIDSIPSDFFENGDRGTVTRLPHFSVKTASGSTLTGWTPTAEDMLAHDWHVVRHSTSGD